MRRSCSYALDERHAGDCPVIPVHATPRRTRTIFEKHVMTRDEPRSQQVHAIEYIGRALADRGLDLERLARRMRAVSSESDATGKIGGPPWRSDDVRALNMNLVPADHGGCPALQSLVAQATLMAYLGEADASLALALPGPGLAMPPVVALASTEQREQFLRRFESDSPRWGAFARLWFRRDCHAYQRKKDRSWLGPEWNKVLCHERCARRLRDHVCNDQPTDGPPRYPCIPRGLQYAEIHGVAHRAHGWPARPNLPCSRTPTARSPMTRCLPAATKSRSMTHSRVHSGPGTTSGHCFPQSWSVPAGECARTLRCGSMRAARPRTGIEARPVCRCRCSISIARSRLHGCFVTARPGRRIKASQRQWIPP